MPQKNIKIDQDTDMMLEDLVDLDRAKDGESSNSKVIRDLIRSEHRLRCPEKWSGSYYKDYLQKTA